MRRIFVPFTVAALMAGCAVAPPAPPPAPVVAVAPVPVVVACNDSGDPVVGCYSQLFGYYTINGWDYVSPAPVGFVANVGIGFGGGSTTVINNTVVNRTVINKAVAHPSFAAAHPGLMAGLRNVGHAAAVGAKAAGKVAVAAKKKP